MRFEPQQRAQSPQLAAGTASDIKIRLKVLTVEDHLQLAAGFFKFRQLTGGLAWLGMCERSMRAIMHYDFKDSFFNAL
jgi:hypothetical protein